MKDLITVVQLLGALLFLGVTLGQCGGACDDRNEARAALDAQGGFTDVIIGDHAYFTCGSGDMNTLAFKARNQSGMRVAGAVCCGYFTKGCTVRYTPGR